MFKLRQVVCGERLCKAITAWKKEIRIIVVYTTAGMLKRMKAYIKLIYAMAGIYKRGKAYIIIAYSTTGMYKRGKAYEIRIIVAYATAGMHKQGKVWSSIKYDILYQ